MAEDLLEEELETFRSQLDHLLATSEGEYALVKDGNVLGTYKSREDAVAEGYRKLGRVPFLAKHISTRAEVPLNFTSNLLSP